MDLLRTRHVHSALPVVAIDVMGFESFDEAGKGGFKSYRGEGVVFDDLFIVDSQELVRGGYQYFET